MYLILLTGYARSGKGTTAECLKSEFRFIETTVAFPLRDALTRLWPPDQGFPSVYDDKVKDDGFPGYGGRTPRDLMVMLGRFVRDITPTRLIDHLIARLPFDQIGFSDKFPESPGLIVSDVRYKAEVDRIREAAIARGWRVLLVRIVRTDQKRTMIHADPGEREVNSLPDEDFDVVIKSPTGVGTLREAVRKVFKNILAKGEKEMTEENFVALFCKSEQKMIGKIVVTPGARLTEKYCKRSFRPEHFTTHDAEVTGSEPYNAKFVDGSPTLCPRCGSLVALEGTNGVLLIPGEGLGFD